MDHTRAFAVALYAWSVASLFFAWSPPGAGSAQAHENHHHEEGAPGDGHEHLAAMEAIKSRIPPELRSLAEAPASGNEATVAAAAAAYREHCAPCHGEGGRGDGAAGLGLPTRPADFLDPMHAGFYTAGERFWIITNGVPELGMPAFGETLDEATRWGLVTHLLRLQGRAF